MQRVLRLVPSLLLLWALVPVGASSVSADTINVGIVSLDPFISPNDDGIGLIALDVFNLTGDPASGGFALDPDFPSHTPVTFLAATLTLVVDGNSKVIDLGDLAPGLRDPALDLLFPDAALISSLAFSATLSTTSFLLGDASTFVAASAAISLSMLPANGVAFTPGEAGVIQVERASEAPEPFALLLVAMGLGASAAQRYTKRKNRF